jgi:hypothetical protein
VDITKLKGPARWTYFYLYVIIDIFSGRVVGWSVADAESTILFKALSSVRRDCPNIGGSCRFSKGRVRVGGPVKSMPKPGTERAVIDCTADLEQQIGAFSRPSHLLGLVHAPVD